MPAPVAEDQVARGEVGRVRPGYRWGGGVGDTGGQFKDRADSLGHERQGGVPPECGSRSWRGYPIGSPEEGPQSLDWGDESANRIICYEKAILWCSASGRCCMNNSLPLKRLRQGN